MIDRAALPWRRCQTGVGGHLPAVVELAEQALRPEDGGGLGAGWCLSLKLATLDGGVAPPTFPLYA